MAMHAHRCMECIKTGKNTVWIHDDTCAGNIAAHKCPECGEVQWKKWMVEIGKLPPREMPKPNAERDTLVMWAIVFASIIIVALVSHFVLKPKAQKPGTGAPAA